MLTKGIMLVFSHSAEVDTDLYTRLLSINPFFGFSWRKQDETKAVEDANDEAR